MNCIWKADLWYWLLTAFIIVIWTPLSLDKDDKTVCRYSVWIKNYIHYWKKSCIWFTPECRVNLLKSLCYICGMSHHLMRALDHAKWGTTDLGQPSQPYHLYAKCSLYPACYLGGKVIQTTQIVLCFMQYLPVLPIAKIKLTCQNIIFPRCTLIHNILTIVRTIAIRSNIVKIKMYFLTYLI